MRENSMHMAENNVEIELNLKDKNFLPFNILLVEDELLLQIINRNMLESMGFSVDIASSGKEALRLSRKKYDLILMDIGLPDISGIDVTAKIRHREFIKKNKKPVPIVAFTSYTQKEMHIKCLSSGMNNILIKPTTKVKIRKLILNFKKYAEIV
jgi:two-component system, OmpR family, aerobic respiration control sensor histidine kinase ArcB